MTSLPDLGVGIVFLPGLGELLRAGREHFDVIEVEPQPFSSLRDGRYRFREEVIAELRSLPQPKLVHGVGAPVGGTVLHEPLLDPYFQAVEALDAPWASEHLTFNRVQGRGQPCFTGFMLPPLQTAESVDVAVANISTIKSELGVPFAFETPVNYLRRRADEMSDGAFFGEVARRAECGILLDLFNVWCNERNGRQSVEDLLVELPLDRVWEVHMAGGRQFRGYWVDAHSGLIPTELFELAEQVIPQLSNLKAMLFEIMPDYLEEEGISTTEVLRQAERMRNLWEDRGSAQASRDASISRPVSSPVTTSRWEAALGGLVTAQSPDDDLVQELSQDPGLGVYRTLAESVRAGMIADLLPLTYRLLMLTRGEDDVQEILRCFWRNKSPRQIAIEEARSFARWLSRTGVSRDANEVAAFELATYEVRLSGESRTVCFNREPTSLLSALGAGELPQAVNSGRYELTVEA